ncbi:MAG TPA: efflux RND transporter periplasmic adaptor subunit [Chiayiivirga sp.]|nr:efflux RND transporter periplasmic adaptor subunit [Chiayiivirga sp.]
MTTNPSAELLNELRLERRAAPPPARFNSWWALVPVLLLLAAGAAWYLGNREKPLEVRTAKALSMGTDTANGSVLDASGYVVARRMATVSSKVTGRVQDILIQEGMKVEVGQVMARLDPVDAQAQLDFANAQASAARSAMASIQVQVEQAETEATRLSELVGRKLVSASQYDAAKAQRDSLRAQYVTAQRNAHVAQVQVEIADNGLDNTIVRAPFAGVVIAKAAQPGEIVSPMATGGFTRTGIGTIVDMDSLEVEVDVGESFIGRVQPGMEAEVVLNAYPDWHIPAEVIAIIPAADRGKATVKVRVGFKQKDARIVPDMGVRVSFLDAPGEPQSQAPQGVQVPQAAIVSADKQVAVFVVKGERVSRRAVTLGAVLAHGRQVLSGVTAGDVVVLDPPPELKDGDAVKITASP